MTAQEGVPQGTVFNFTMESADSKIYPGIAREPNTFGTADPTDPAKLIVTTSHPAPYTRRWRVCPQTIRPRHGRAVHRRGGRTRPGVVHGPGQSDRRASRAGDDRHLHRQRQRRRPGSERGLEYDTMSGLYAEFVEKEVLPLVRSNTT
jgi:enterochelin esterase family protein